MAKKQIITEESLRAMGLIKLPNGQYSKAKSVQQPREVKKYTSTEKGIPRTHKAKDSDKYSGEEYKEVFEKFAKDHINDIKPIVDLDWNCGKPIILSQNDKHLITFDVDPIGKPRMTQSDKWKKRSATDRYWIFKNKLQLQAKGHNFKMPESNIHMIFRIEMPQSWAKSKKLEMLNKPHQQKPDADNILKGVQDSLCDDDSYIWDVRISKFWDWKGSISIYNIA